MKLSEANDLCIKIQKMVFGNNTGPDEVNTYRYKETAETAHENDVHTVNDIVYSSDYPNSVMDLWYPSDEKNLHTLIIYMHGGGMLFGDKASGDPLAKNKGIVGLLQKLAESGYTVASLNYVLAPEYIFPAQLKQIDQAIAFLKENQEKYRLNMKDFIIAGSSAGANLTGIYGTLLCNSEYREKTGIHPCVDPCLVRCLVIDEAVVGIHSSNEVLEAMLQTWVSEEDMETGERSLMTDFPLWIKDGTLPSYIIASNQEPEFYRTALRIKERADDLNVRNEMFYTAAEEESLSHGFLTKFDFSPSAALCLKEMMEFISEK
ncbi:MAG: alpha/beta hydrolase [Solobacterium sp.]|nr:alpha/beta hydrolase [Solobacterium sp.]